MGGVRHWRTAQGWDEGGDRQGVTPRSLVPGTPTLADLASVFSTIQDLYFLFVQMSAGAHKVFQVGRPAAKTHSGIRRAGRPSGRQGWMKRLMDESEDPAAEGLVVEDGGGPSPPSAAVPDRRHRRVGRRARSVHAAARAAPRRQRDGVRPHPAPRSRRTRACLREALGQGDDDAGQPGRGRHARRAEPRLRHPAKRGHRRSTTAGSRSRRGASDGRTVAPAHRLLLRSLAAERGSHAIGVVLSGTASDGTEGLAGDQGRGRHHVRAGSRTRRSSAACRAARSTPASSTTACRSPSSPASSCA